VAFPTPTKYTVPGPRLNGLALQFHPEVTASGLERWFINALKGVMPGGQHGAQLRQEAAYYIERLELQAVKFWHAWLKKLGERGFSKLMLPSEPCLRKTPGDIVTTVK